MNRSTLMLGLVVSAVPIASAAPPAIECLSDISIEELWRGPSRGWPYNDECLKSRLIVLVGAHGDPDPSATWAVFNEPEILDTIAHEQITLIFYEDEEPGKRSLVDRIEYLSTGSWLLIRDASGDFSPGQWHTVLWPMHQPSPEELLAWIKDPEQKRSDFFETYQTLSERLEQDPTNIQLRFELIGHCQDLGGYPPMAIKYVPWLLLNNEKWYLYETETNGGSLTEDQFRTIIFNRIRSAREQIGFFGHATRYSRDWRVPKRFLVIKFHSWIDRIEHERTGFWSGFVPLKTGVAWKWSRIFKPYVETIQSGGGTDRDRFIAHALTAEGEQWQALIKQYSYDSP